MARMNYDYNTQVRLIEQAIFHVNTYNNKKFNIIFVILYRTLLAILIIYI